MAGHNAAIGAGAVNLRSRHGPLNLGAVTVSASQDDGRLTSAEAASFTSGEGRRPEVPASQWRARYRTRISPNGTPQPGPGAVARVAVAAHDYSETIWTVPPTRANPVPSVTFTSQP